MNISKKDIITKSWKLVLQNISLLILCISFIFVLNVLLGSIQDKLLEDLTIQSITFTIAAYLFQMGLSLGVIKIYLNIYNNKEANFKLIFESFHLLVPFLTGSLLIIIIMFVLALPGLLLLYLAVSSEPSLGLDSVLENITLIPLILIIVPIIYISLRFQFFNYFLVEEECDVIVAIKKSFYITQGRVLELLTLGALISLIILISIIPLGAGLVFSIPLSTMVNTSLYKILKMRL
tara:strand:+ start:2042 stop:2746 length:705 start_codon:yes stop_codon:yes gene_type:complete